MGKKSTAQPRPKLNVPPRGIGPIDEPNENDVLCGRGGRINSHEGNIRFRDIIHRNKKEYLDPATKKLEKAHIAKRIVDEIRNMNPPGRFLKEDTSDGYWYDIGDAKAIKKTGQALREDAPGIRNEIENELSSGDEGTPKRKATAAPSAAPAATNGTYVATSAPAGYAHGHSDGIAQQQQQQQQQQQDHRQWMPEGGMHRQHSAPFPHHHSHASHEQHAPPHYQQNHGPSSSLYNMPSMLYSGVRSTGNKFRQMSQTASEAMRQQQQHQPSSGGGVPPDQVAFGRVFTPTVMSSGSTMSTISGLSSGISGVEQQSAAAPASAKGSFRLSQLSDMTMTTSLMSLGSSLGLTRSNSLPELGLSKDFTSLSDSSFAVLMEDEEVMPNEQWAHTGSTELRDSSGTGTSSSTGNRPPPFPGAAPPRTRTTSAVSAMSWASMGSQPSNVSSSVRSGGSETSWLNPIRSRLTGSVSSDHSFGSSRSVLSDMSADVHALDLEPPKISYM